MDPRQVRSVVESLQRRAKAPVDHDTLTAVVEADFHRYDSARIKDFVPALVERDVRARLITIGARRQAPA
jgi:hypothetical protein